MGIAVALLGGPGWEAADDYASLVAAVVIAVNGTILLRPAIGNLMTMFDFRDPHFGTIKLPVRHWSVPAAAAHPPTAVFTLR